MMRARILAAAACAAVLAGCALFPGAETQEPAPAVQAGVSRTKAARQPASNAETLMLYYRHLRRLSGAALEREHEIARLAYLRTRADYERVRLAIVLSVPGTPVTDEARALELLDPVARNAEAELQGLAYLFTSHLHERRRLDASAQGLQQKLDALKSLERTMIERKRQ